MLFLRGGVYGYKALWLSASCCARHCAWSPSPRLARGESRTGTSGRERCTRLFTCSSIKPLRFFRGIALICRRNLLERVISRQCSSAPPLQTDLPTPRAYDPGCGGGQIHLGCFSAVLAHFYAGFAARCGGVGGDAMDVLKRAAVRFSRLVRPGQSHIQDRH